jgi:hypothetical protein
MSDVPATPEPYKAPPSEDDRPKFTARGRDFHVRPGVPALLLEKVAKKSSRLPRTEPGTELNERQRADQMAALAASYDLIMNLIVPDERNEFEDHINDAAPVVEGEELSAILGQALAAASGRPTSPS